MAEELGASMFGPEPVLRQGWLKKRSPAWPHPMQRRLFVLTADALSYYRSERDEQPTGAIPLRSIAAVEVNGSAITIQVEEPNGRQRSFELTAGTSSDGDTPAAKAALWRRAVLEARDPLEGVRHEDAAKGISEHLLHRSPSLSLTLSSSSSTSRRNSSYVIECETSSSSHSVSSSSSRRNSARTNPMPNTLAKRMGDLVGSSSRVWNSGNMSKTGGSSKETSAIFKRMDRQVEDALQRGIIRLLSVTFLLSQPDDWHLGRRQDLERDFPDDPDPHRPRPPQCAFLRNAEAVKLLKRADRSVFVLSYRWLTAHDPDAVGTHLHAVRAFFLHLRGKGLLPYDAGLFWDYGCALMHLIHQLCHALIHPLACLVGFRSLHQHGRTLRTPAEQDSFREALGVMAYLYASPLGTCVLQHKAVPSTCPPFLDLQIIIEGLKAHTGDAKSSATFQALHKLGATHAEPLNESRNENEPVCWLAKFASKAEMLPCLTIEDASKHGLVAARSKDGRLMSVRLFARFNGRLYDEAGWPVFETFVSKEALSRCLTHAEMASVMHAPPRTKMYEISTLPPQEQRVGMPVSAEAVLTSLKAAKFTGKGDVDTVCNMYRSFQQAFCEGAHEAEHIAAARKTRNTTADPAWVVKAQAAAELAGEEPGGGNKRLEHYSEYDDAGSEDEDYYPE
jgi:hypothetical protein